MAGLRSVDELDDAFFHQLADQAQDLEHGEARQVEQLLERRAAVDQRQDEALPVIQIIAAQVAPEGDDHGHEDRRLDRQTSKL